MTVHIDKDRLDTDIRYRFDYLANFLNFTNDDIAALNRFSKIAGPFIESVVDIVYQNLIDYDVTKDHLLKSTKDFQGTATTDPNKLTIKSEQIVFRIKSMRKYLNRILRQTVWNDAFLEFLSNVGKSHTKLAGTQSIDVEYMHINALFGFLEQTFIQAVLNNTELDLSVKRETLFALSKVFWIQNDLFAMHYLTASRIGF